jgi:hypothetical protein
MPIYHHQATMSTSSTFLLAAYGKPKRTHFSSSFYLFLVHLAELSVSQNIDEITGKE